MFPSTMDLYYIYIYLLQKTLIGTRQPKGFFVVPMDSLWMTEWQKNIFQCQDNG